MEAERCAEPSQPRSGAVPRRPCCPSLPNPLHWGGTRRDPSLGAGAEGGGPAARPSPREHLPLVQYASCLTFVCFCSYFILSSC